MHKTRLIKEMTLKVDLFAVYHNLFSSLTGKTSAERGISVTP